MLQAYTDGHSSINSLEAKAVGVLQAAAIVLATIVFVLSQASTTGARVIGFLALSYLVFSVASASVLLRPMQRNVIVPDDVIDTQTGALAELAASSQVNVLRSVQANNFIHAAVMDVVRAGFGAAIAVIWQLMSA